jgi:O-antigen/teichoic acid export membrane protein
MIRKNIFANFIGRVWGIVSVYLFIPLYLKFLGIEAYGLVGFYSTLLGVLAFADIGLTATLSREMARLSVRKDSVSEMSDLVRTYESIYLYISVILASILWFSAPFIAERWLRASTLPTGEITSAIRIMGISIALQLPANLYSGGLLGLQKQVLNNSLQIGWGVLRGVGAVLVLWLVSPTIIAFAFWQLFSNAVYCFAVRMSLWRALPRPASKPHFSRLVLRNTWRYAAGMAGMTFLSAILKQTDKLVVSKMLSLEIFGYYTLAASLAMAPQILALPIGVAAFPLLTGLVSRGDSDTLTRTYHRACKLVSVAALPAALTLAIYAGKFIFAWTGSSAAAQKAGLVASLLLFGSIVQAILIIPYYLALAHGNTKLNLWLGLISVILITPLLIFLILKYGIIGGGVSWLVMNVCTLPPYIYFIHRRFLLGELKTWVLSDIGRPLLVALPIILLGHWLLPLRSSRMMILGQIGLVWGISSAAIVYVMPEMRREIYKSITRIFVIYNNYKNKTPK